MRFIHMADIHLGAMPDKEKSWSEGGGKRMERKFYGSWQKAGGENIDFLFIGGEKFHGRP